MGAKITGLDGLTADLRHAIEHAIPNAKKIAGKGALKVKKEAQRIIRGRRRSAATCRTTRGPSPTTSTAAGAIVTAVIGPKTEKLQGGLGKLLENGSVNNAPIPHLGPALDLEENVFFGYMEEHGEKLLEGADVDGPVVDPG
jgi:hypothetical protein